MEKRRKTADYYIQGILNKDKFILSKAISIMESSLNSDVDLSSQILRNLSNRRRSSIRIGITGSPGVGKSTFIETFGNYLISKGKRVAVLAVDPSSSKSGGSILGDKTRMNLLSRAENAFIRPSPSKSTLGGVSDFTRENILLCEAGGFDVVIVETVGVGQSETLVHSMVDFFLLLAQPGAGDELQGIKKGIVEMADGIVINKADGELMNKASLSKADYQNALHLFSASESGWMPKAMTCSALENNGIDLVWEMVLKHHDLLSKNGFLVKQRSGQNVEWFRNQISQSLFNQFLQDDGNSRRKTALEKKISNGELTVKEGLNLFLRDVFK